MKNPEELFIVKASGEKELFSDEKLRRSLNKIGVSVEAAEKIIGRVKTELKPGMTTAEVYRLAFSLLKKTDHHVAGRYALKRAIMELGPNGHPFEKFVGEILKKKGFSVTVGKTLQGVCVSHEIDVIAEKDSRHIMVECKFHNEPGIKSDVKISLYVQARFEDVQKAWQKNPGHGQKFHEAWLVTNTKLTSDAIRYASCAGMKAIGWSYPPSGSLEQLVEESGLHPLTCLTTLSASNKRQLLDRGLVLCKELFQDRRSLKDLGLSEEKITQIEKEIHELCGIGDGHQT